MGTQPNHLNGLLYVNGEFLLMPALGTSGNGHQAYHPEAGGLIQAAQSGKWSMNGTAGELAGVVNGKTGRRRNDEMSLHEGVGTAWQDLAVAAAVVAGVKS